jgi:hypothetical protein
LKIFFFGECIITISKTETGKQTKIAAGQKLEAKHLKQNETILTNIL